MTLKRRSISIVALGALLAFDAAAGAAQTLYRYKDENGQVFLASQVPPDKVANGYEIIDKNGNVEEVVPPALTPEQREQLKKDAEQKVIDQRLRSLYSSYEEIDQARDNEVGKLRSASIIMEGNIRSLESKREKIQSDAATLERGGKPVPPDMAKQLFEVDAHIKIEKKKLIDQKKLEQEMVDKFASDRKRLGEILNLAGSNGNAQTTPAELKPLTTSKTP